jgi:peptide/nickel transport system permease protein
MAARASGARHIEILLVEILPNILPSLTAFALIASARAFVAEGSLSFLGLSVAPPQASWGGMIAEGREHLTLAPHTSLIPAAVMFLTVLSVNLLGDVLRARISDVKEAHI